MPELDLEVPIPVLVVGVDADRLCRELNGGLVGSGRAAEVSCAAFDVAEQAADASAGATHLILIATGPEASRILDDPAWDPWHQRGFEMARIAVSDDPAPRPELDLPWLAGNQSPALPALVRSIARALRESRLRKRLARELATERACEPLSDCLEPGELYTMAIDLLLEQLGRRRGIALFAPSPAPQSPGVAARGFDDDLRDRISRQIIEDKGIEVAMSQGEVAVVPWGPVHHVLGRLGIEAPGALLSIPLRGDTMEVGQIWILAEGRRFDAVELATARTIARRASAALTTAERYHRAKERAFIDDVTGVYNARYLLTTADNEIQRAARYGNPLSVLFLDLDRFKSVNDRYGHLIGSDTLRALSELLAQCVRQVDTLARYGGDEFTILLVDTPHETALRIAERIRARVEAHRFEAGREGQHQLTISIGVASYPQHGEDREALLDAADKAMYRAKSHGRNRICSADELTDPGCPRA